MKDFKLLEHNLIPCSLFILNMSAVHLIYLFFMNYISSVTTMLVFSCTIVLIAGVIMKKKILLIPGAIIYLLTLILSF